MNARLCAALIILTTTPFFCNAFCGNIESHLLFSLSAEGKVRLGIINTSSQKLNVEVVDKSGNVLFEASTKGGTNYFKLVDFLKLSDGDYEVHLSGLPNEIKREFTIKNNKISIAKINKNDDGGIKPVFSLRSDQSIVVSYLNTDDSKVRVAFEQNGDVVFQDQGIAEKSILKKYSLKQLAPGKYEVKVYSGEKMFSYPIEIK